MSAVILKGNELHDSEIKYHVKFGHAIGWIQKISIMIRIEIFYTSF